MRKVLLGCLMSGMCLSSFGGQGNAAGVNIGGRVGDTYIVTVNPGPAGFSRDEFLQEHDARVRTEAELAREAKLRRQKDQENAKLRKLMAEVEQENRNLKYASAGKNTSTPGKAISPTLAAVDPSSTIPTTVREIFVLMERSEADRASLSKSLAQAPDRLETTLKSLIAQTESFDDAEREKWYALLPQMALDKRLRLFDILSTERRKLADLERKYRKEIDNLNTKHLDEWIALQRNHLNENDPDAICAFAANLIDSTQPRYLSEAEGLLLQRLRSDAGDAEAHYHLGRLYGVRKQWQDAQDFATAALRLAPDKADYHALLGRIFLREEKKDKALAAYARAFNLGSEDTALLHSYGVLLLNSERHAEAEPVLRRFLELDPKDADAYRLLGMALRDQDRFAEAEKYLKQAFDFDSKNPQNRLALAWLYYRQGRYAQAESTFGVAATLDPDNVDAATMLSLSIVEQGRRGEALPILQTALKEAVRSKVVKSSEAEIRLGAALLLSDDGRAEEGKALMADAATDSQGCSAGYMKTRRNWHEQMLRLLGKWRESLCGA